MINLHDLVNWVPLEAHDSILFASRKPRPITLEVNCDGEASLYVHHAGEKEPRFLAAFTGRDTIKFVAPSAFQLINKTLERTVYVLSTDSSKVHRVALEEEVFTSLHEPTPIDPHMQKMLNNIEKSVQRRLTAQQAHFDRELAHERELAAAAASQSLQPHSEERLTGQAAVGQSGGDDSEEPRGEDD